MAPRSAYRTSNKSSVQVFNDVNSFTGFYFKDISYGKQVRMNIQYHDLLPLFTTETNKSNSKQKLLALEIITYMILMPVFKGYMLIN